MSRNANSISLDLLTQRKSCLASTCDMSPSTINDAEPEFLASYAGMLPLIYRPSPLRRKGSLLGHNSLYGRNTHRNRNDVSSMPYNNGSWASHSRLAPDMAYNRLLFTMNSARLHGDTHFHWVLQKLEQPTYLPHYCEFISGKALHERAGNFRKFSRNCGSDPNDTNNEAVSGQEDKIRRRLRRTGSIKSDSGQNANIHDSIDANTGVEESISNGHFTVTATDSPTSSDLITRSTKEVDKEQYNTSAGTEAFNKSTTVGHAEDGSHGKSDSISAEPVRSNCLTSSSLSRNSSDKQKRRRTEKNNKLPTDAGKQNDETNLIICGDDDEVANHTSPVTYQHNGGIPSDFDISGITVPKLPPVGNNTGGGYRDVSMRNRSEISMPHRANIVLKEQQTNENSPYSYYSFYDIDSFVKASIDINNMGVETKFCTRNTDAKSLLRTRFELPADLKSLEYTSPQDYLRKYCIISSMCETLHRKMFHKYRTKAGYLQTKSTVYKALNEILVSNITAEEGEKLCSLLEINDSTLVDFKLFSGMAALAERIQLTSDNQGHQKEHIEDADFSSLTWKMHDIQVTEHMRLLLESL